MNTVAFDTHAAIRKLQDADLSERQAEVLVEVFSRAIGEPVTRTDLDVSSPTSEPSSPRSTRASAPSRRESLADRARPRGIRRPRSLDAPNRSATPASAPRTRFCFDVDGPVNHPAVLQVVAGEPPADSPRPAHESRLDTSSADGVRVEPRDRLS